MKKVVGLVVFFAICGGIWFWGAREISKDPGIPVFLAFGKAKDGTMDLIWVVDMAMPRREGPKIDAKGNQLWDLWVPDHFKVYDESGTHLELERAGGSQLFNETKIPGAPEFYLRAKVQAGKKYTFDYVPQVTEAKIYRHTFVAPGEQQTMERTMFALVEK